MASVASKSVRSQPERPSGRAVVPAILWAAAELFAERGPANTSLREVAARANVTYGLVFRHFGTKAQLVGAVLDDLGQRLVELISSGASMDDLEPVVDLHARVMARAVLDGYAADQLQTRFPANEALVDELAAGGYDELQARLIAANCIALQLGWRLFEPYLRASSGLQAVSPEQLRASMDRAHSRITKPDQQ